MKRLFSLLLLVCSFLWGDAQTVVNRSGAANTVSDFRLQARTNLFIPRYADTASVDKGIDSCGAQIYTYDVDGYWYRACFPAKHWARVLDARTAPTVTNVSLISDNSINVCNGVDDCDTLTFVTTLTDLTSAYLLSEDSLVVCNISACDTVAIPRQRVYLFQNGLTPRDGITEWGGPLLHNTEVYGAEKTILFTAHPVYNYPFGVQNGQRSSDGGGLQYWHHVGTSNPEGQPDLNNKVRLALNYTGAVYPTGSGNLPSYFGGKIGYFLGTNTTPEGSYGLKLDEPSAKIAGVFFHTWDTDSTDAITLYGQSAPGASHVASVNTPSTMLPTRIATFRTNRDLTLWGYDSSSRNDGVLTKVLGTDQNGNVLLGTMAPATHVIAGTNVSVSGTGSLASPYVISATATGSGGVDTSGRIYYSGYGLSAPNDSTLSVDTSLIATTWDLGQLADTSGRTYYVRNGLSARNDSTFVLGGALDGPTEITMPTLDDYLYIYGAGAELYLGVNSVLSNYAGGYAELDATGGGKVRLSTDSTEFLGWDALGAQVSWKDPDGQTHGLTVSRGGNIKIDAYPSTRSDGLTSSALYVDGVGNLKHDLVAPVRSMVSVTAATSTTLSGGGEFVYTGTGAATWTMPAVAGNTRAVIWVYNQSADAITLNASGGASELWVSGAPASTLNIPAAGWKRLVNTGTYWIVYN